MIPAVAALLASGANSSRATPCSLGAPSRVAIAGFEERGEIRLADGRTARLVGLDVPDSGRGDGHHAGDIREFLENWFAEGEISFASAAAAHDRWGRTPGDFSVSSDDAPLSIALLRQGLARVRPEPETRACADDRFHAEAEARHAGLGVWIDPYYSWLEASDVEELRARDGQFVLVEGVVVKVTAGRNRTYLDFGGRGGFSVVVPKALAPALRVTGVELEGLRGSRVRVRGAMDARFGPRMEIADPRMIERVESAGSR